MGEWRAVGVDDEDRVEHRSRVDRQSRGPAILSLDGLQDVFVGVAGGHLDVHRLAEGDGPRVVPLDVEGGQGGRVGSARV